MSRGLRPPALMQLPQGNGRQPVKMQSEASQEQKEVKPMRNASKRMGKKGTLTIPQHLRHELGLEGGTAVDLTPTGDGW